MNNNLKNLISLLSIALLGLSGCGSVSSSSKVNTNVESSSSNEINTFHFPDISTFRTPAVYSNTNNENWEYHATVSKNTLYVYVVQHVEDDIFEGDEVDLTQNHILVHTNLGNFTLCSNGAYSLDDVNYVNADFKVSSNGSIEYYFKLEVQSIVKPVSVTFYSYDQSIELMLNTKDLVEIDGVKYRTHFIEKLYVRDRIGFKPESLYETPSEFQSMAKDKWGYAIQSAKEGMYIYVYQNVDKVISIGDADGKWQTDTHVEFSIYHHSFGMGATYGGIHETYLAAWPDKSYYINNQKNVLGIDLESTVATDTKVEYRFFIRFNNNLENPKDGPYSFIKIRAYDPTDNKNPYSNDDIIEYREERFLHTTKGDSLYVNERVSKIDNPYENLYLDIRKNKWNNMGFENAKDLTLFIGDSFFEDDNWWKNFYTDFANKSCFTSAIGGTKVTQWLNWIPSLVGSFDKNLKNIVIHLGYNDVNSTKILASELEKYLEKLFTLLHEEYPNVNIYYFGIGTSHWFEVNNNKTAKEVDNLTKAYTDTCDYVTFIDMDAIYSKYRNDTGGTLESFFKDGTHPKDENYKYLINALTEAGCVIVNK